MRKNEWSPCAPTYHTSLHRDPKEDARRVPDCNLAKTEFHRWWLQIPRNPSTFYEFFFGWWCEFREVTALLIMRVADRCVDGPLSSSFNIFLDVLYSCTYWGRRKARMMTCCWAIVVPLVWFHENSMTIRFVILKTRCNNCIATKRQYKIDGMSRSHLSIMPSRANAKTIIDTLLRFECHSVYPNETHIIPIGFYFLLGPHQTKIPFAACLESGRRKITWWRDRSCVMKKMLPRAEESNINEMTIQFVIKKSRCYDILG